ncbi:MAG: thiamine-phosphate kinase, partial [Terriglobia bacterium]
LQSHAPQTERGLRLGIGDDAALVRPSPGHEVILTTDLTIEGIHFTRQLHPPESVGHRALARALSDIAAMGGTPRFALVSIALSRQCSGPWVKRFYQGLFRLARQYGVSVIGGDTAVHTGPTMVDVLATGEVRRGRALLRSGARAGDQIFVGGRLGRSALGLKILKAGTRRGSQKTAASAVAAHLFPEPQCRLGEFLCAQRIATAAMDLSDGLSLDLSRLCKASGVGASIHASLLPLPATPLGSAPTPGELERLAFEGGEDYKLLFTVPPRRAARLPARLEGAEVFRIGEITKARELLIVGSDGRKKLLGYEGYDHFQMRGRRVREQVSSHRKSRGVI